MKYKEILARKDQLHSEIEILKKIQFDDKLTKEQGEMVNNKIKSKMFQYKYYTYLLRNYEVINK